MSGALLHDDRLFDKIGGWLVLPAFLHPIIAVLANFKGAFEIFKIYSENMPYSSQVFIFSVGVEICEALRFVPNDHHGVFCTYNLIVSQADCTYKKACRPQIKPRRSGVIKFRHKPVVLAHDLAQLLF